MSGNEITQRVIQARKGRRHLLGPGLPQPRGTLDVGQKQRRHSRRQKPAHAKIAPVHQRRGSISLMLASVRPPRAENISGNAAHAFRRTGWDAGRRAERSTGIRLRATGGRPTAIVERPHHDTDFEIYISGAQHHDSVQVVAH